MTNGAGMMRFSRGFLRFGRDLPIAPVALRASVPPPWTMDLQTHTLTSSFLSNLFWFCWAPSIRLEARVLQPMTMRPVSVLQSSSAGLQLGVPPVGDCQVLSSCLRLALGRPGPSAVCGRPLSVELLRITWTACWLASSISRLQADRSVRCMSALENAVLLLHTQMSHSVSHLESSDHNSLPACGLHCMGSVLP